MSENKRLLEAALFMASRPMGLKELARIAGLGSLGHARGLLQELQAEYAGRAMVIEEIPTGWEMRVRSGLLPRVAHLTPYADMPEGCKRTLALVAYKEPITQSEVIRTQGNKAYSYIKQLIRMGLVKAEKEGRTRVLGLTREFENYFGEEREKIRAELDRQLAQMPKKKEQTPETEILPESPEQPEEATGEPEKKDLREELEKASELMGIKEKVPKKAAKDGEIKF